MSRIRPASVSQRHDLRDALLLLELARDRVKRADCPSLLKKIRSAIKSAGGAQRHMQHRLSRSVKP